MSGVSNDDQTDLVLQLFDTGLPAFHRMDSKPATESIQRIQRNSGAILTAKWMGSKLRMVLLAWQRWASEFAIFRAKVTAVLYRARELFQEKSYGRGPDEGIPGFVHDLPLAAVATEQLRHGQFASAAAGAMVGCEELVRQTAAWEAGVGERPTQTGVNAMMTEKKLAREDR